MFFNLVARDLSGNGGLPNLLVSSWLQDLSQFRFWFGFDFFLSNLLFLLFCWILGSWAFGVIWGGSKHTRTSNHSHQLVWAGSTRARKSISLRKIVKTPSFVMDFEITWVLRGFGCRCFEDIFSTLPRTFMHSFKSIRVDLVEFYSLNWNFLKSVRAY